MQSLFIGVTTKSPDSEPLPLDWKHIDSSDQYWYFQIESKDCTAWYKGQKKYLKHTMDHSPGSTFGVAVSEKGELHLYHNRRDVGVALRGLPTDKPLWGFLHPGRGWKVETNYYIIAKGEVVACDEVVCGVMLVSLTLNLYMLLSLYASHGCSVVDLG